MPPKSKPITLSILLSGCALAAWPAAGAPTHAPAPSPAADSRLLTYDTCVSVLEGDLIEGKKVGQIRLVGIIAPTAGEAGYHDAMVYTKRLVLGRQIKIDICGERPNDYRGRLRAVVYLPDSTNLNTKILRSGWARVLDRKPCHLDVSAWQAYETQAHAAKLGMWAAPGSSAAAAEHAARLAPAKPAPKHVRAKAAAHRPAATHRVRTGAASARPSTSARVRIRPKR